MKSNDWLAGGDRHELAAERIYAAAASLIARRGLDRFDLDSLAQAAHCSRATIYRHAGGKTQIRDEVLARSARRINSAVMKASEGSTGGDRVVEAVTAALREIRSDPVASQVFTPGRPGNVSLLADSGMLARFAAESAGLNPDDTTASQWINRVTLSLLFWPGHDEAAETRMLRSFVSPAFRD
ncbi:MAG: TetR/AcrR family transcriptional regulator [Actinomycetes bacterium]